jgi:Transposase DDE domain
VSRHPELYQWNDTLAGRFPKLPRPLVWGLALWTLGMILARRCGLSSVALMLAPLLGQPDNTLRQRLKEFYLEAAAKGGAKRGRQRHDFAVADCFAPLLAWVLSYWGCRRLVLALDPTTLGDRLHVLCVSAVYRGLAIPVAWKVLAGNQKEAWHPHWCDLLGRLRPSLGEDWRVLVLTDRGLESPRLFQEIVGHGWHPLMRVKANGKFRPTGWYQFYAFGAFAPRVGARFAATGTAYKTSDTPLSCTLLACWTEGHEEPWLLLTDLGPQAANPCWYAFRAWIEQQFKVIKRGGWQWQLTKMADPARVERKWLTIAVATLWLVAVGGESDEQIAVETVGPLPPPRAARGRALPPGPEGEAGQPVRRHRVFARGAAVLLAALLNRSGLPPWHFAPDPWPEPWHDVPTVTEEDFCSGKFYP